MVDWQELANAAFIAIIFAYMLAKLISVVASFREDDLRIERGRDTSPSAPLVRQSTPTALEKQNPASIENESDLSAAEYSESSTSDSDEKLEPHKAGSELEKDYDGKELMGSDSVSKVGTETQVSQEDPKHEGKEVEPASERTSLPTDATDRKKGENLLSDSDDWEGVESTELDETFGSAASFVAGVSLDPSVKVSSDLQLQFYGLYKQATEGPCSAPQPSAYKLSARAKWHAWKKLGDISPEESMRRYITLLSELFPDWNQHTKVSKQAGGKQEQSAGSSERKGGIGPVFSILVKQESSEEDGSLEDIHIRAKEGDVKGIVELLERNTPVDQRDSDGRTALHWAVDHGRIETVKLLISQGAQINAKDLEGQTALHYATTCQWEEIAEYLLEHGADPSIKDNDGNTPYSFHPAIPSEEHEGGKEDS